MKVLKTHKCFDGQVKFCEHDSQETKTSMKFSIFLPPTKPRGCLIWLSGLTCNEENFITKAGAQRVLAEESLMIICPDTSPRGLNLPGEHDSSDFGSGAGFYVDSTTPGYKDHYRMFSYISKELYSLIQSNFEVGSKISISGHSMGGHGALVLGLRENDKFVSVSAFAPIVNPVNGPWGQKAFKGYLGDDQNTWKQYDACELLKSGKRHSKKILVDQGSEDSFLRQQLLTENFAEACLKADQQTEIRLQDGYDHSYYFVSSFIADHIRFHAKAMVSA